MVAVAVKALPGLRPGRLPSPLTRFVGRSGELRALREALPKTRLLTLTGVGGVGKTRLAIELVRSLQRPADAVAFVDLAAVLNADMVIEAIAAALGVRAQPPVSPAEVVARRLRDSELLLILDNCERLIGPSARTVDALLRDCPGLNVLATSRESLRVPGELVWTVPSLALPRAHADRFAGAARSEAVTLFAARVSDARPNFVLSPANIETVVSICRIVEGLPLAIELAATRARFMSEDEILARLRDRFDFLTDGARTAPERHRSLRATIEWSYELLSDAERALFRRLAVFSGGFGLDAVAEICVGPPIDTHAVVDLASSLLAKSLAIATPTLGGTRIRLLESLREYGYERLRENGEAPTIHGRHAAFFLALAEQAIASSAPDRAQWDARLQVDVDNVRAALDWTSVADLPRFTRLAVALGDFWIGRGYLAEGDRWLDLALAAETRGSRARMDLLDASGYIRWHRGDFAGAIGRSGEAVDLARTLAEPRALAHALVIHGFILTSSGELGPAECVLDEALALGGRLGDPALLADALGDRGLLALHVHDLAGARARLEGALELERTLGRPLGVAGAANPLGFTELLAGDVGMARARFAEALRIRLDLGDVKLPVSLDGWAEVHATEGRWRQALRLRGAADALYGSSGSVPPSLPLASRERWIDRARRAVGRSADATVAEGRKLDPAVAAAYALQDDEDWTGLPRDTSAQALSEREREIAALVAAGLRNREIAMRLGLSERTVEAHLEHIRTKLDVRNRMDIARWVESQARARQA